VDAWTCLRDGYLGSTIIPDARITPNERLLDPSSEHCTSEVARLPVDSFPVSSHISDDEPVAQIYLGSFSDPENTFGELAIEAVDHFVLSTPRNSFPEEMKLSDEPSKPLSSIEEEVHPPLVDAAPIRTGGECKAESALEDTEADNVLSASMQSLVDGLMSWGGQYDSEDDLNLPVGMATSIVLEGSGITGVDHN
jgi:hypothetical protein